MTDKTSLPRTLLLHFLLLMSVALLASWLRSVQESRSYLSDAKSISAGSDLRLEKLANALRWSTPFSSVSEEALKLYQDDLPKAANKVEAVGQLYSALHEGASIFESKERAEFRESIRQRFLFSRGYRSGAELKEREPVLPSFGVLLLSNTFFFSALFAALFFVWRAFDRAGHLDFSAARPQALIAVGSFLLWLFSLPYV